MTECDECGFDCPPHSGLGWIMGFSCWWCQVQNDWPVLNALYSRLSLSSRTSADGAANLLPGVSSPPVGGEHAT